MSIEQSLERWKYLTNLYFCTHFGHSLIKQIMFPGSNTHCIKDHKRLSNLAIIPQCQCLEVSSAGNVIVVIPASHTRCMTVETVIEANCAHCAEKEGQRCGVCGAAGVPQGPPCYLAHTRHTPSPHLRLPVSHTFPNPPLFRIFPAQLERQETAAGFQ